MNPNIDIQKANQTAIEKILSAQPVIRDILPAREALPGLTENTYLHAGPPVKWENMCGPLKGAIIGALIYEGRASNFEEGKKLAESGEIKFAPCHHFNGVGPMAGVVSPSMPVWVIENTTFNVKSFCTLNEGLGKVLRYGAYSEEVITRLKWIENTLAPVLKEALTFFKEPINLKNLIAQSLQMGDECHNRNKAATSLLIREIAPSILKTSFSNEDKIRVLEFIHSNDHFFLNLSMPAAKSSLIPAENIPGCTLVTTMARNGTEFGIRVSGLGDQWFTGPAQIVKGLYFTGYTEEDANPDIGDSVITETLGIGGFSMAAAPAIVQFVGGTVSDAMRYSSSMYEITHTENNTYKIPALNFKGSPTGIDILKVVEFDLLPIINTGVAHKEPGVGQVGAGLVNPPKNVFTDAIKAFDKKYN